MLRTVAGQMYLQLVSSCLLQQKLLTRMEAAGHLLCLGVYVASQHGLETGSDLVTTSDCQPTVLETASVHWVAGTLV